MHLTDIAPILLQYRYWIIIPLSMVEGPMVAVITGALSARGHFNPYIACGFFVAKDVIVDGSYYLLGHLASVRSYWGKLLTRMRITGEEVTRARGLWRAHGWRTMFVAKFAWGVSPLFLVIAGLVGVPTASFFGYAAGVALLQYVVLFVVGYYFGVATAGVSIAVRVLQGTTAIGVLGLLVWLRRRLRPRHLPVAVPSS
jgi:membrane protein DedA with SNARE-associated domain